MIGHYHIQCPVVSTQRFYPSSSFGNYVSTQRPSAFDSSVGSVGGCGDGGGGGGGGDGGGGGLPPVHWPAGNVRSVQQRPNWTPGVGWSDDRHAGEQVCGFRILEREKEREREREREGGEGGRGREGGRDGESERDRTKAAGTDSE
jgi:hypothetical protein